MADGCKKWREGRSMSGITIVVTGMTIILLAVILLIVSVVYRKTAGKKILETLGQEYE